jgi:hypothetical protein
MGSSEGKRRRRKAWENEILANHRWGQHGDKALDELGRLTKLWEMAQPLDPSCSEVITQILSLEICNWDLEESILVLCGAIGGKEPTAKGIGHLASVSEERWRRIWAYYMTLRNWLPSEGRTGYPALRELIDPGAAIEKHVLDLLGERAELKELYVERFCLCLEFWLGGLFPRESAQMCAHRSAESTIDEQIMERDSDGQLLAAMKFDGDGKLEPCHHKAFRRYDIIISSIGAGRWRAAMPPRKTDGFERAACVQRFLSPIESWIAGDHRAVEEVELSGRIHLLLGEADASKLFLASLLASLLRSQQLAAKKRAERGAQRT